MSDPLPSHTGVAHRSNVFVRAGESFQSSPEFRYLWLSNLLFAGGSWAVAITLGWLVFETTGSEFLLAVFTAVRLCPMWLGPVSVVIADRYDRVLIVKIASVWSFVIVILLALSVSFGYEPYWLLVLVGLLTGLAQSPSQPARSSLMLEMVGRKNIANANGLNSMAMGLMQGVAPALTGVIISTLGAAAALWFGSLWYLVSALMIWKIGAIPRSVRQEHEPILQMVVGGLRIIMKSRLTSAVLAVTLVANFTLWPVYNSFMPVFAKDVLGLGADGLGWLLLCAGMGSFCGAFFIASLGDFRYKGALFLFGTTLWGVSWAAFGLSDRVVLSFVLMGIVGLTSATFGVMQTTLMLMTSPPEVQGRALGIQELAIGAMPIGSLGLGVIAAGIGVGATTFFAGLLLVSILLLVAVRVPELVRYTGE
ncbi:MAG: MFS transporter [Thermomicrobiales bacterium]|nr:MFS transporter [Thermomicrobiales bacterium]MCO5227793.1 MFS transporter [Thermomicrobiales bacterium]